MFESKNKKKKCIALKTPVLLYEPRHEKPAFCICENKDADQLRGNREADQHLCFRYTDNTIPLLPKSETPSFHASIHLLWLYSPVCVGPGRKPRRPVFSQRGSYKSGVQGV